MLLQFANAFAQEYPNQPIRFIVPNPPGGSTDLVACKLAAGLAIELGQPTLSCLPGRVAQQRLGDDA